ncbi:8-amino-7-oxononanoate synthase [Methylohalomonas lacus]|uniref:8-amino-7-oxononanoate synthase n=1 Tax=Methylohalomonas lacus TaxID=398773 RepID=A0AAE3L103_9GAMM|nr:8-amino-7-oxononanoate synthase [Methylohalomonas lacus]MCS3903324.1 8-amino-7-oxononanoate synthase [Methylohalomonas lacus]
MTRRRQRRTLKPLPGGRVEYKGRSFINFCSNDYLGLAQDERIVQALKEAADEYGVGSGASQLITGYSEAHEQLEQQLADFTGYDRALFFSNGYMANLGVITALADRHTSLYLDRLAHASLIDATRLSRARYQRYAHNSVADLMARLADDQQQRRLVVSEGVFSMEGDRAPLIDIAQCCQQQKALFYLDDAHGFGVLGEQGRGSRSAQGLDTDAVPLQMATFGKALGVSGAFVAGSHELIETILQRSRTLTYSTAPPPALARATATALTIVIAEQWRRDKLEALVQYWRRVAHEQELPLLESDTAIQPLLIGADADALAVSESLMEHGLLVSAIRPPTVPEGEARLRITLTSAHEQADIDRLVQALAASL